MRIIKNILKTLIIVIAVICSINFYRISSAESYINGSISVENKYSTQDFKYSTTDIVFVEEDTYIYQIDLLKVQDFDGVNKNYSVYLNEYLLICDINYGSIKTNFVADFYDENGNKLLNKANLEINVRFLNQRTELELKTETLEEAEFFEQFFSDYGFRLEVKEITKGGQIE